MSHIIVNDMKKERDFHTLNNVSLLANTIYNGAALSLSLSQTVTKRFDFV